MYQMYYVACVSLTDYIYIYIPLIPLYTCILHPRSTCWLIWCHHVQASLWSHDTSKTTEVTLKSRRIPRNLPFFLRGACACVPLKSFFIFRCQCRWIRLRCKGRLEKKGVPPGQPLYGDTGYRFV